MDPISATAGVVTVLGICLRVSVELKKFRNSATEARGIATAMLADITSLRQVLQAMEDTFDEIEIQDGLTGHIGLHWRNLMTSLQDGHIALEELENVVQTCNRDVAVLDQTRRRIRLKSAAETIAEHRQQIQTYKDTLQLSLQTIILWNSCSIQASTTKILPNLEVMHAEIRRLATNLDVKLQAMQEMYLASNQQAQIDLANNLKECVCSAATVVSSASTTASVTDQETPQEIDEFTAEIETAWFQPEIGATEATQSWNAQRSMDWPISESLLPRDLTGGSPMTSGPTFASSTPNIGSTTVAFTAPNEAIQAAETLSSPKEPPRGLGPQKPVSNELTPTVDGSQPSAATQKPSIKVKRRSLSQLLAKSNFKVEKRSRDVKTTTLVEEIPPTNVSASRTLRRKLVFVGDGACGKTSFLLRLSKGVMPMVYVPTVFDNYEVTCSIGDQNVKVGLWDTAGQEDYDRLRPLSYPDAHGFCICFSIDSPDSLSNVWNKWSGEINHFRSQTAPIILIGLKQDLREDVTTVGNLLQSGKRPVSSDEALEMKSRISASTYLECSALTGFGIETVWETIIGQHLLLTGQTSTPKKKSRETRRSFLSLFL